LGALRGNYIIYLRLFIRIPAELSLIGPALLIFSEASNLLLNPRVRRHGLLRNYLTFLENWLHVPLARVIVISLLCPSGLLPEVE